MQNVAYVISLGTIPILAIIIWTSPGLVDTAD